jgi:dihydropteroate synthase
MGILNVTPDSFSDGGKFSNHRQALKQIELMISSGADIIDIGGESTRPGAVIVSEEDELSRVIPLLKAIKENFDVEVSIDTSKAVVMAEAITYGADMINDVYALQKPDCLDVVKQSTIPICLMHMQGSPQTMQNNPHYDDIIKQVSLFFEERIMACDKVGIDKSRLILDPGFGFGKTLSHNYQLLAKLSLLKSFDLPLLSGISRKSMIGDLLHRDTSSRMPGSIAAALISVQQGANIIRVHDVQETVDALKVLEATTNEGLPC